MKVNLKENLVCKHQLYLPILEDVPVTVSNKFEYDIKKINQLDWVIYFYFTKKFKTNMGNDLCLYFQSISVIHLSNDHKQSDENLLRAILIEHETENNRFIKEKYFSKLENTEHLFFSLFDENIVPDMDKFDKMLFAEAGKKGIEIEM